MKGKVKTVEIGNGITYIGKFSFYECKALTSVVFEEGSVLKRIGWGAFGYCTALTEITIPATVEKLDGYAFYYCTNLATVNISEGSALTTIGQYAFWNATKLTVINDMPENVKIGTCAFLNTAI